MHWLLQKTFFLESCLIHTKDTFFLLYQICDLPNTKITNFIINKIPWNLTVWRNLIKSWIQNSKLDYLGMKKSMSDFEHISLLALYSYGVIVSGKSLKSNFISNRNKLWSKLSVEKIKQLNALKRDQFLQTLRNLLCT